MNLCTPSRFGGGNLLFLRHDRKNLEAIRPGLSGSPDETRSGIVPVPLGERSSSLFYGDHLSLRFNPLEKMAVRAPGSDVKRFKWGFMQSFASLDSWVRSTFVFQAMPRACVTLSRVLDALATHAENIQTYQSSRREYSELWRESQIHIKFDHLELENSFVILIMF